MPPPVLPVIFPLTLSSADPACASESARLLADRIIEVREQFALLLGLPLDTPLTQALTIGGGLLGLRGCDARSVDNTHMSLDADQVMLRSASPGFVVVDNPTLVTNDLALGGPVVNGRDQVAVFPINSFVHFYWIYNGTVIGSLSSLAAPYPGPGPVLPTGYFLGAYVGATLLDASGFLVPSVIHGRWTIYRAARSVYTSSTPGTLITVTCTSCVPSNAIAIRAQFLIEMAGTPSGTFIFSRTATLFDGLSNEVGSAAATGVGGVSSGGATAGRGFVVVAAPQYGQILQLTHPSPLHAETNTSTVKIIGFENANNG
jgi:hypothetical protein